LIKVSNSLSRKKEEFKPLKSGVVNMYACGVTPYDEAHIGHAMQAIIFDTIRRYLEFKGYKVNYVRNFTDVDDKIINRANKEGLKPLDISKKYINETKEDLKLLKIKPATYEPLVSKHIKDIIDFVQGLVEKGFAYKTESGVYFDVLKFKAYGKLSGRSVEDLRSEDSKIGDKKNPLDFSLWKKSKPGEPKWDSPWGEGRPGWHIECSALAKAYLGDSIDIHGGGIDIIFPHHENEVAQSEALTGKPFAKYWLHNGLLMVGKQKMSKSLGNFLTVKDALKKYMSDVIRYMILSFSYNSSVNFEEKNLSSAEKRIYYYYSSILKLNEIKEKNIEGEVLEDIKKECESLKEKIISSMDDNFNSAKSLSFLNEFFTSINQTIKEKKENLSVKTINEIEDVLSFIKNLFSILDEVPSKYIESYKEKVLTRLGIKKENLESLLNERNQARKNKDFKRADEIRDDLLKKGIFIMDVPGGKTDWMYNPK
jgi:cysteinyl-tRNA synthetase